MRTFLLLGQAGDHVKQEIACRLNDLFARSSPPLGGENGLFRLEEIAQEKHGYVDFHVKFICKIKHDNKVNGKFQCMMRTLDVFVQNPEKKRNQTIFLAAAISEQMQQSNFGCSSSTQGSEQAQSTPRAV